MKNLLTYCLIASAAPSIAFASIYGITNLENFEQEDLTTYGTTHLKSGTINNNLTAFGAFKFEDLTVKNNAKISGAILWSHKGTFKNLKITGKSEMTDITCINLDAIGPFTHLIKAIIKEKATINGPVKFADSQVKELETTATNTNLDKTTVKNIYIKKGLNPLTTQTVHLNNDSKVQGKINFESGRGVVIDQTKSINSNQIEGGALQHP